MSGSTLQLNGKNVIVTGAAQGIGRAIAHLVLELGGSVTAVDINPDGLQLLQGQSAPGKVLTLCGSVTDAAFAQHAVEQTAAHFGGVHGLVNNAGFTRPAMIEKMTREQWQQVIDVHLTGSFYFLQAVGVHVLARSRAGDKSGGSIVNISSDAGRKGTIGQINYSAAKAGVLGITMSAAREWARYNLRVNTVGFGVVETQMTETIRGQKFAESYLQQIPLGRWGSADEVALPVCFLLSDAASYITGQHLSANGGFTICS